MRATVVPQPLSRAHARWCLSPTLLVLLAACGGPPTDMSDMRAAMNAQLTMPATSERDATTAPVRLADGLAPSIGRAVAANQGYLAAQALERQALRSIGVAASLRRPQVGASTTIGAIQEAGAGGSTTAGVAGGFNVSQLVYDGGESTASINRATAEALAAQADRLERGNEIAFEAARAWIDVWQFDQRLSLLRTRTAEMERLLSQIERMAVTGMVDRAALDGARRQIVDVMLAEAGLTSDLAEAQARFHRYFGIDPGRLSRPSALVTTAQARAAARDWQHAPSLQRSAAQILAARSGVDEATSARRPRIRIQAGVRSPMARGERTDASVGLMLEHTFSDGGRRQAQLEAAEARAQAMGAHLQDAQAGLQADLSAADSRLAGVERSMPLVADKIRLSASEAETSRSQIATGQSDLRRLVEAEIENYRARDQQIALQAEQFVLQMRIAARIGLLGRQIGLDRLDDG